jgi:hypothetical protein
MHIYYNVNDIFQFTTVFTFINNHCNIDCMYEGLRLLKKFKFFQLVIVDNITYINFHAKSLWMI